MGLVLVDQDSGCDLIEVEEVDEEVVKVVLGEEHVKHAATKAPPLLQVKWIPEIHVLPDPDAMTTAMDWLQDQLVRLDLFAATVLHVTTEEDVPAQERKVIVQFHEALTVAMRLALQTMQEEQRKKQKAEQPCDDATSCNAQSASTTDATDTTCLLYTSDAADDPPRLDLGGRRLIQ